MTPISPEKEKDAVKQESGTCSIFINFGNNYGQQGHFNFAKRRFTKNRMTKTSGTSKAVVPAAILPQIVPSEEAGEHNGHEC